MVRAVRNYDISADQWLMASPTKMKGTGTLRGLRLSARASCATPSSTSGSPKPSISHAARKVVRSTIDVTANKHAAAPRVPNTLPSPFAAGLSGRRLSAATMLSHVVVLPEADDTNGRRLSAATTLSHITVPSEADGTNSVELIGPRESPRAADDAAVVGGSGTGPARISRIPVPRSAGQPLRPIQPVPSSDVSAIMRPCLPTTREASTSVSQQQPRAMPGLPPVVTLPAPAVLALSDGPALPASQATMSEPVVKMHEGDLAEAAANAAQVLRVDLSDPSCFEQATEALGTGERVLAYLTATSRSLGVTEAVIWRELLAEAGHGIAGTTVTMRSPPAHMAQKGAAGGGADSNRADASVGAVCLRDLLRLSVCDDNDLNLVRRVMMDSKEFFSALRTAAGERSVPPSELWYALDALER